MQQKKKRRMSSKATPHVIIPVEKVTPAMLAKVKTEFFGKKYDSAGGTSCHQCRQKTADTKTCCR